MRYSVPIVFLFLIVISGCSRYNYAPVRSYHRDIPYSQKYYTVRRGDTLYGIGVRSGHGYKALARWNHLHRPYFLQVGQRLKLFNSSAKAGKAIGKVKKTRRQSQKKYKTHSKTRNKSQKNPSLSYGNQKLLKFHWQWPLKGKIVKTFSQTNRKGIDIKGWLGQKVRAAAAGKVVYSGQGLVGYGNLIIIRHNGSFLSAYANNRRLLVREGQTVKKGQAIAEVGRLRGKVASLHFEIRNKGNPVNPLLYLPKK